MTRILHLHTYFLFAFTVDRDAVAADHPNIWARCPHWIDGLDAWIDAHHQRHSSLPVLEHVGPWRPSPYKRFDLDSEAYQDMVFFHPYVRRIFFHVSNVEATGSASETLVHCYTIDLSSKKLRLGAADVRGRSAVVDVTDLRMFLFANGIGILSIGIEALDLSSTDALWINEMMRKVYPSSGRQIREGRAPNRMWLSVTQNGIDRQIAEETFAHGEIHAFQPPMSNVITSLLYFTDYTRQEYEPVLDERMIVYTYAVVDPATCPEGYIHSEDYQVLLSRFLYVDRDGSGYRYDPAFTRELMSRQLYTRWAHLGTYYGFTSYSNISITIGTYDCDEHVLREGFLVHRMFRSRYYLMGIVALFYRATLLDFAEKNALVSQALYRDEQRGRYSREDIRMANTLRAEFLHFANYWYFEELANKDEEIEHFTLQCSAYRVDGMKSEIEEEIEKLNASLIEYYQTRNTEAVNRMALLTVLLGAGALITGYFGMNFSRAFGGIFFEPSSGSELAHWIAIVFVSVIAVGAIGLGVYMIARNWADYREIVSSKRNIPKSQSLKRRSTETLDNERP